MGLKIFNSPVRRGLNKKILGKLKNIRAAPRLIITVTETEALKR